MANTYTTSTTVRLYDQRTPTKLLHPETELSAVFCTSGGLVVISDNNIEVPESSVGAVISASGFIQEPILETTTGGTVTNIGNSTGYGTLLKTISTTDTVRLPATSASNDYVPTELAVAVGLDRKQAVLSAGSFITLTPDNAGHDIIAVSPVVTEIRSGASAVHTALPTEKAVQIAIGVASASAVTEAMASVGSAGYATQTWANAHFLSSGGEHDWGYANNQAAGVVRPLTGSGLIIGDAGALSVQLAPQYATYATASAGSAGIVRVTSEVVSAANATEKGVTVVPTTDAVYRAIQAHSTTQKPISSGSGIIVTDANGSYTIALKTANATSLGGVAVPTSGGLVINGGSIAVAGATVQANYTDAHAVPFAGVRVLNAVTSTNVASDLAAGYVPSVQAVYAAISASTAGVVGWVNGQTYATENWVGEQSYATQEWTSQNYESKGVVVNWGTATASTFGVVKVPASNGLSITNGAVAIASAGIGEWGVVTMSSTAGIFASDGYIDIKAATGVTGVTTTNAALGGVRILKNTGISITAGTTGVPDGTIWMTDASTNGLGGVVLLSGITAHASGNTTTYWDDNHIPTEKAITEYVQGATTGVLNVVGATYATTAYVDQHAGISTPAQYVDNRDVITADGSTISLGGVRIVKNAGLGLELAGTTAGNLYISGASVFATYAAAAEPGSLLLNGGTGGNYGGVKVMTAIESATGAGTENLPIVPTVDAVYTHVSAAVAGAIASPAYYGDFKVTAGSQNYYQIAAGNVYLDGSNSVYVNVTGTSIQVTAGTGCLWAVVSPSGSTGTVTFDTTPDFTGDKTSVPIAFIAGTTVCQYQYGPIVIRGRWR